MRSPTVGHTPGGALFHGRPCRYRQLYNVGADHGADHQHAQRPRRAVLDLAASARSSRARDDVSGPHLRHTRERPKDGRPALTVINSSLPWCT
jgi:hypothetical protein